MAWQVYNYMEPCDFDTCGPLPRKRWVKRPGEKYKMAYKAPRKVATLLPGGADAYNKRNAIAYARWLAARDGITIPTTLKCRIEYSYVYSSFRKRKVRSWAGVSEQASGQRRGQRRIRSVSWGRDIERYFPRKDGRQGAWTHTEFVPELTIAIPHWDFEHPPIEETIEDDTAKAA
jgi:hypothetical protein